MTAEAQHYSNLKQTADELWADNGDRATPSEVVTATQSEARIECHRSNRYDTGAIVAGKYQLIEELGQGGMGSVWVAKNRTLDVDVAIKLVRAEIAHDVDGIAERMLQEARAAARIGHPAIIQVFDFGFAEHGDPFIVMELLRGESLDQALQRRRRVSPNRAAQTLLPIIDALAATHAHGIVHRDLKPANIFLARPPGQRLQPKVLDFGVAKLERRASVRLTQAGALVGSPAYMSPEQFLGNTVVDGRADIWALCVVLYEMITSHRPFDGDGGSAAVLWRVTNVEPRPIAEHGIDEPALWQILAKGFAKEPGARHESMRAFGTALAEWLVARGVNEDICDASLRTWTDPVDSTGVKPIHSFFPSQAPAAAEPLKLVVDPLIREIRKARISSGTRPVLPAHQSLRARFVGSKHKIVWLAVVCTLVAFVGTAILAGRSSSPRLPAVNRQPPVAHAAPASPPVSSTPPVIEPTPILEPAADAVGSRRASSPKIPLTPAPRARKPQSPANQSKATRDLKNPFN
jgi:eukaryotic-like serine/threonine-protein kinase